MFTTILMTIFKTIVLIFRRGDCSDYRDGIVGKEFIQQAEGTEFDPQQSGGAAHTSIIPALGRQRRGGSLWLADQLISMN